MSPASLLYPYGLEHEDEALLAKDNDFSEELQLLEPFTFFEIVHRMAYVNALTLGQRSLSLVHPNP